jgi:hypothetical protein
MRKSTKIVVGFAAVGFVLPLLLMAIHADGMLLIYLCPPSIVAWAFAIDGPGWLPDSGVLWLIYVHRQLDSLRSACLYCCGHLSRDSAWTREWAGSTLLVNTQCAGRIEFDWKCLFCVQ